MKAALTEKGLRQSIYVNPITESRPVAEPPGAGFLAERTKPAGTEFLAERTELDADGQEKEKIPESRKRDGFQQSLYC